MAEQSKPPLADVRQAPLPPKPQRKPERELPKVGDRLWYRLTSNNELVAAEVIDSIPTGSPLVPTMLLNAPSHGNLHLKVELDPERHFSSGPVGYRQNVPEISDADDRTPDRWQRERPDSEDDTFAREQYTASLAQEIRGRIAKGQSAV